ncbi:MAG: DUF302 domain-containing protein [Thermoleophilia bacterium]|nr:DUF302 domain-containing protein [Thermoleophilia bacterium]
MGTVEYSLAIDVDRDFDDVLATTRQALADEGFGVLTEIDVKATMKAKLDVDREEYVILGACNPPLAHQALEAEPELGVLLPCNVVVYRAHGKTRVSAVAAEQMLGMVGNQALEPVATEVAGRLRRVLDAIAAG